MNDITDPHAVFLVLTYAATNIVSGPPSLGLVVDSVAPAVSVVRPPSQLDKFRARPDLQAQYHVTLDPPPVTESTEEGSGLTAQVMQMLDQYFA